jgi:CRISPR/Cas system-associated endoribonuclease Cas2
MNTYIISYDLKDSDSEEYVKLKNYFKKYKNWAHINESLWAVKTNKNAEKIRDEVKEIVNKDSSLFVIKSGIEAAWRNVLCRNIWLKRNL